MSADTRIAEGHGSPRSGVPMRSGTNRQKVVEEENKAGKVNDAKTTRPRSDGNNSQGNSKAQDGAQRKRGEGVNHREGCMQSPSQEGAPQIKEMLAEMLTKRSVTESGHRRSKSRYRASPRKGGRDRGKIG